MESVEHEALREAVWAAGGRAEVREAVGRLYADVAKEIDARRPVCAVSGRCCRFEEYGHRLYVTTIELAAFVYDFETCGRSPQLDESIERWSGTGCPFQLGKLCGVHLIRPFGCRMFFCDPTSTEWQNNQYERFHARLKLLHEELGVPYAYLEWRVALKMLGLAGATSR